LHLPAKRLKRWVEIEDKLVYCETGHLACPEFKTIGSVASNNFRNTLMQSLVNAGYIKSIEDIADAANSEEWHVHFPDQLGERYDQPPFLFFFTPASNVSGTRGSEGDRPFFGHEKALQ
jgi:hypothetical protein